jgi:hypothetical protein
MLVKRPSRVALVPGCKQLSLRQRGSMLLFFAVGILPMLLLLWSMGGDLLFVFDRRESLQKAAEKAALAGARLLPYQTKAYNAALAVAQRASAGAQVKVDTHQVSVTLATTAHPPFATFFNVPAIPLEAAALARVSQRELTLIVDTSQYLSPEAGLTSEPWGLEELWPAATVAEKLEQPRVRTQRCYNPPFSAIKEAAIRIADFHLASGESITLLALAPDGELRRLAHESLRSEWCESIRSTEAVGHGYRIPSLSTEIPGAAVGTQGRTWLWELQVSPGQRLDSAQLVRRLKEQLPSTPEERDSRLTRGAIALLGDIPWVQVPDKGLMRSVKRDSESGNSQVREAPIDELTRELNALNEKALGAKTRYDLSFAYLRHEGTYNASTHGAGCDAADGYALGVGLCTAYQEDSIAFEEYIADLNSQFRAKRKAASADYGLVLTVYRVPSASAMAQDLVATLPLVGRAVLLDSGLSESGMAHSKAGQ